MASNAVVGLLRALLTADVSQFSGGLKRAATDAAGFKKSLEGVQSETLRASSAVDRMARSLGGSRLLQTAQDLTAAVAKVGGVAKLTEGEQARLNTTLQKAIEKYTALGKVAPAEMLKLEQATRRVEAPTNALTMKMVAAGAAIGSALGNIAVGAIAQLGQGMITAASQGVQLASLVTSFDRLASGIGETGTAMLGVTRSATKGLIADLNIMQSANKAMLLGLPVTSAEMAKLAQTAVVLGKAMGQDATKSLDDLITALGRSSPMILDNLGLTVKVGEANEAYAAKLGKTADQLTDAEKKMAFYQAAMAAAETKTATLGGVQLTLSDHLSRVTTGLGNIVTGWTRHLAQQPKVEGFLKTLADKVTAVADALDVATEAQRRFNAMPLEERRRRALSGEGPESMEAEIRAERIRKLIAAGEGEAGAAMLAMRKQLDATGRGFAAPKDNEDLLAFIERKLTKAPEAAIKAWETSSEKLKKLLEDIRTFGEEQFRQLMAVTGALPHFGALPRSLALENALGPPPGFNPGTGLSQIVPSMGLPEFMQRENMGIFQGPGAPGGFSFSNFLKGNLGNTLMGSVMGGGSMTQSLGSLVGSGLTSKLMSGALGKTITKGLTGSLGKMVGGTIAGMIPGIGAVAGPLLEKAFGAISGMFGGEGRKTNKQRDSWVRGMTGLDDLPEAQAALRKMAMEAGATDAQVRRLFDSRKVKDFEAAQRVILDLLDRHKQKIADMQALTDAQAQRQQMLNDAVARYGFETSELGPLMRRQRLAEHAEELLTDWKLLEGEGFDINVMAKRMSGSINEFIHNALRTGTEVPLAMRPMLEAMVRQGLLTDLNDDKILDLKDSGIVFGNALVDMFTRVLEKLDELIDRLTDAKDKADAAAQAAREATEAPGGGGGGGGDTGGGDERFHQGGIVAHAGRFLGGLKPGEVFVRALTGEGVLNRMATSMVGGKSGIDAMNRGDWRSVMDGFAGLSGGFTPAVAGGGFDGGSMSFSGMSNAGVERRLDGLAARADRQGAMLQRLLTTIPIEIESAMTQGRARR